MDMIQAMKERHMVRKYTEEKIPKDLVDKLNARIKMNNDKHGLSIKLVLNDGDALSDEVNLVLSKNVNNFFVMAGRPGDDEKCGYAGADLMIYAQSIGLNTWWVGGQYNHKRAQKEAEGAVPVGIIAVGFGETQGRPHDSKSASEVSSYEGTAPKWFEDGIEAALLAPTAKAAQAFTIEGQGTRVHINCDNGVFSAVDTGIIRYHFELGANGASFEWI
ncbi:MAG: nitroreductase [Lachnospiraceae bacterium]|nr:nitroreductase [Lachnospiraceae bacterium]